MDTEERLQRAEEAFANGEYRAAIIDAKNILQQEPDNVAARLLLGRASVEIGDGVSGEKELRRAAELGTEYSVVVADLGRALVQQDRFDDVIAEIEPELAGVESDRLSVMRSRGEALLGLGQPDAARAAFTAVLDTDPGDLEAQLGIVGSHVAERNFLLARELLDQVQSRNANTVSPWLASGDLYMRMRDTRRAQQDYEEALELATQGADTAAEMTALAALADTLLTQDLVDQAKLRFERMREIGPDDIRTLLIDARLAAAIEDWATAQERLQQILRLAPDFRQAQMLLGYVHKESGNLSQAEMYLAAVVSAVPGNANARRLLAEIRLQMNKAEEARQALNPILSSADASSLSLAASASFALGQYDTAIGLLERLVDAEPEEPSHRIQLALAYFRAQRPAKAQEILEAQQESIEGIDGFRRDSLLILTKMAQGDRDEALADANRLLEHWPQRADAHSLVGSIQMSIGDFSAARASFEAAGKVDAGNTQSLRYLAELDEIEGDPGAAATLYERILELAPGDTRAMIALARMTANARDYDQAREWLERARAVDADAVEARHMLGSLLLALGKFEDAEVVLVEALEFAPDNPSLVSMMGIAQFNRGASAAAEASFGRAMELEPDQPEHRLNLARSQVKSGRRATALDTMHDAMEQTMQHVPSAVLLASLRLGAGDVEGAEEVATQLRQAFPDDPIPLALAAELNAKAGDFISAAALYDRALDIRVTQRHAVRAYEIKHHAGLAGEVDSLVMYLEERPFDSNMRIYLAQAYQALDQIGKANTQYERVLSDEPDNFIAANNLAWSYFRSGNPKAPSIARHAYDIQPENVSVMDTLGWILVKTGELGEGLELLRNAASGDDGSPGIRYHLAAALVEAGEMAEAKSILEDVLRQNEGDFPAKEEVESLLRSL